MKLEYNQETQTIRQLPGEEYDSEKLYTDLKNFGVIGFQRQGTKIIIICDRDVSQTQMENIKQRLQNVDITQAVSRDDDGNRIDTIN